MNFAHDSLALTFASAATVLSGLVLLYGEWYFQTPERRGFRLSVAGCWAASVAAFLVRDWLFFVVFVELATLFLWRLIAFRDRQAAALYLLVQLGGAGLVLIGAAGTAAVTGSTSMGPAAGSWRWFFLAGLGVKTAFPGLHFWLPEVQAKAPAPASAMLSGIAEKLGLFGLLRAFPEGFGPLPSIGVVMVLYGAGMALFSRDIKRLLAYSTMSHLGYMTAAAGVGAATAAAMYAFVHAFFKGLLFLSAGLMERAAGTRDLLKLTGAARAMPLATAFFAFGAFCSSGFPWGSAYAAKSAVLAVLEPLPAGWLSTALTLSGILTTGYLLRALLPLLDRNGGHPAYAPLTGERLSFAWASLPGFAVIMAASALTPDWIPGIASVLPAAGTPGAFYLLQAGAGGMIFVYARNAEHTFPQGLPDLFPQVMRLGNAVAASSSALAQLHGGVLNVYALLALSFLLVLLVSL